MTPPPNRRYLIAPRDPPRPPPPTFGQPGTRGRGTGEKKPQRGAPASSSSLLRSSLAPQRRVSGRPR